MIGDHLEGGGADLARLIEEVGVAHARGEGDDGVDVPGVDGDDGAQVFDGLAGAAHFAEDDGEQVADLAVVRAQADGVHQMCEGGAVALGAADGEREHEVRLPVARVPGDDLAQELGGVLLGLLIGAAHGVDRLVVAVLEVLDLEAEHSATGEGVVVEGAAGQGEDRVEVGAGGGRVVAVEVHAGDVAQHGGILRVLLGGAQEHPGGALELLLLVEVEQHVEAALGEGRLIDRLGEQGEGLVLVLLDLGRLGLGGVPEHVGEVAVGAGDLALLDGTAQEGLGLVELVVLDQQAAELGEHHGALVAVLDRELGDLEGVLEVAGAAQGVDEGRGDAGVSGVEVEGLLERLHGAADVADAAQREREVVPRALVGLAALGGDVERLDRQRDRALIGLAADQDVDHRVQGLHRGVHLGGAAERVHQG